MNTNCGRLLLIKLGVIGPLVALGAANRFWNVPALLRGQGHARRLRNTVRGEVVFEVAVLSITGILASSPHRLRSPSTTSTPRADGRDGARARRGRARGHRERLRHHHHVTLSLDPGMVGENQFTVRIADFDTGEPLDAVRVALRFAIPDQPEVGPSILELEPTEPGTWEAVSTTIASQRAGGQPRSSPTRPTE